MTPELARRQLEQALQHYQAKRFAEAVGLCREVVEAEPDNLDASIFLASCYRSNGQAGDAVALYDAIAATDPARADFWFNRGNALNDAGRHQEAATSYERSIALDGANASVFANLAIAEAKLGHFDDAIGNYRRALALDPDHRTALHNIGNVLAERGHAHEAASHLRRAVALWPDLAEAHYNLGLVLLRLGDFANGLREYEWRWDTADFFRKPDYRGVAAWNGEPLAGRRLVVHSEQGLGDTIQFAKLLGLVASLGGDVVFHVPEKLERLLRTLPFPVRVAAAHGASDADFQVPLISLMHRLKLTVGSIPAQSSFLAAEPDLARKWAERLQFDLARPIIGFVWQGNPNSPVERGRSLASAEELAPFAALPNARLIALQKLSVEDLEPAATPSGWRVRGLSFMLEHPGPDMDSGPDAFVETAAIMAGLDLVVSVCTAPLHLAGALGRPTIALLKAVPDWRWMMERPDTPWYPAMRLVRQQADEPYAPAIGRAVELAKAMVR